MGVNAIAGAIKEGLSLWKSFIDTRQDSYNRKQDKRQERAIQIAETAFGDVGKLFDFLLLIPMDEKHLKELNHHKKLIYRLRTKFNKYD